MSKASSVRSLFSLLALSLLSCLSSLAHAISEPPLPLDLPVENLDEYFRAHPRPFLPQGDWYSLGANVFIFRHFSDTHFLHGPGYWLDNRLELRPHEDIDVNVSLIAANATSSRGYIGGNGDWWNLGISWKPRLWDSIDVLIRYYDLGRRSLGAGLFIEDREMSGLLLGFKNDPWNIRFYFPGTSVFSIYGDLLATEIFYELTHFETGLSIFGINDAAALEWIEISPGMFQEYPSTFTLYPVTSFFLRSKPDMLWVANAEAAIRKETYAGRLAVGYQDRGHDGFGWSLLGKASYYEKGIVDRVAGNIIYEYLPYSLLFRPYHNAMNVLEIDDDAFAWSVEAYGFVPLSRTWFFDTTIEGGIFDYKTAKDDVFVWHKERFGVCPYARMPGSCAMIYVSNKVLNSTGYQSKPFREPLYEDFFFLGLEAQLLF